MEFPVSVPQSIVAFIVGLLLLAHAIRGEWRDHIAQRRATGGEDSAATAAADAAD